MVGLSGAAVVEEDQPQRKRRGGGHDLITRRWHMAPYSSAWDRLTWGFKQCKIQAAGDTLHRRSAAARQRATGALGLHLSPAAHACRSGTGMERRHARMGVGMQRRRSAAARRSAAGALGKHLSREVLRVGGQEQCGGRLLVLV